jgi:HTH-type transcriptional regulator, sugar sensing transcriptional regulator
MNDQDAFDESVRHLTALGFTALEAAIYAYLVQSSPTTAYRIAQSIGRPIANTYKAVESLQQKGAVIVDESGERRMCRAIPPAELFDSLARAFDAQREAASQALLRLRPTQDVSGVYSLITRDQVFERCRWMLQHGEDVALVDAFPGVLESLRTDLEAAAARGIPVAVHAYAPTTIDGADVVIPPAAAGVLERWPGQWLCLVVDGAEYLFAYFSQDGETIREAIWSSSAFISWVQYSYLLGQLRFSVLERLLQEGKPRAAVDAALAETMRWVVPTARGYVAQVDPRALVGEASKR